MKESEEQWHDIGAPESFADQQAASVQVAGLELAVIRDGDELFALLDRCTHGAARLSDGYVENGCIECPLHQGLFDLRTGVPMCLPPTEPVRVFKVRIVESIVQVQA